MAAIAATQIGNRVPVGDEFEFTYQTTANCGVASATEWIDTKLAKITKVVGVETLGTALSSHNVVLNAQGTGVAAGTNLGDLGIEGSAAAMFQITVRGRM